MNKTGKGGFRDNPRNINTAGAPRLGTSWKEIYHKLGEMSGQEAAEYCATLAKDLVKLKGVTLKEAVALRVFVALMNEPEARLLNAVMDRDEGKVKDETEHSGETILRVIYGDKKKTKDVTNDEPT